MSLQKLLNEIFEDQFTNYWGTTMLTLANNLECVECQRLKSKLSEIQAQIVTARADLQQAIDAADGTSARKYDALEELLKAQDQFTSEVEAHDRVGHNGYLADDALTHDVIET